MTVGDGGLYLRLYVVCSLIGFGQIVGHPFVIVLKVTDICGVRAAVFICIQIFVCSILDKGDGYV